MQRVFAAAAGAALAALFLGLVPAPAFAQVTTTAVQDLSCLGTRANSDLGCGAGDLTATATLTAAADTSLFCQAGQSFTFDADVTVNKQAGNTRYDIGFFTGQTGNAPDLNNATQKCSVATFPFIAPFSNQETLVVGDVCGDVNGSLNNAVQTVKNIKVTCNAATTTSNDLSVPFALSWRQNSNFTCTGPGDPLDPQPGDVFTDTGPKCSKGSALVKVSAINLQVGGYVDVVKQTVPDGDAQTFSYTATGPSGALVGYRVLDANGAPTGLVITNNSNSVTFTLGDASTAAGPGVRVFMSVVATNRTLSIIEAATTHWQGTANISCAAVTGSPTLTTNNSSRQIQASLNTTNSAAACSITNTKRARISLVENVAGRLFPADQFALTVTGAGASTLTDSAGTVVASSLVGVTTTGAGTGAYTNATNPNFRATAGQQLILTHAMAGGSTSTAASYVTKLTCTNAFTGPGATGGLPGSLETFAYAITPAPGDDITCTYTNTPKALLTLAKVVVNDQGATATAADWTLSATGPGTISGVSGAGSVTSVPVTVGSYTLAESGPGGYQLASLSCSGSADADPSDGLALAAGEKVTCTFTNDDLAVAQSIVKSSLLEVDADGSGTVTEGDTIRYTVTVTNTGLAPLSNVQISDAKLTPSSNTCSSVAVDSTCTLSGTHVVTSGEAAAGEIVNTASVTSTQIPGPVSSNTLTVPVQVAAPGELAVVKSHATDFVAAGNGTYTLQVSNIGNTALSGTATVSDTLAPGLGFVSGSGTGWSCGAVGSLVTCTSTDSVAAYASMPPITLIVSVDGTMGSSVDNTASVGHSAVNGGAQSAGNTDTATILHPDLSTSTKAVVDLNGGDVEAGDILEYQINLVESAGVTAYGVHVTDTVQSDLTGLVVTQVPGGGTDNSTAGQIDVSGITVPASGLLQLRFQVTVGSSLLPGDPIDNTATIDNPGGADAAPVARTLIFEQSIAGGSGNKILYIHADDTLDRTPQPTSSTAWLTVEAASAEVWLLSPAIPPGESLILDEGQIDVQLPIDTFFSTVDLEVQLFYRDPSNVDFLIASSTRQVFWTDGVEVRPFSVDVAPDYPLAAGGRLGLRVINRANGNKHARVYEYNTAPAVITFATSTVVDIDSVAAYSESFGTGNAQSPYYVHGDNVWIRATVTDPFGGTDVSAAELTLVDPYGATIVGPVGMSIVDTTAAGRTFEYATTVPSLVALGTWTATVLAHEGSEGSVTDTASGQFDVRGRITLDQAWGSGVPAGDTVVLQVTGGIDATDGSATAPSVATPGTAYATATASISVAQSFSIGDPGTYTMSLACVRDGDGGAIATTGTGLTRQFEMPLNSSVTCTWTDSATVPLTIVKLVTTLSDPVNGAVNPKAIPGALAEYLVIVTNPATSAIDTDSMTINDPLPGGVELRVADIAGSGSGPVLFVDGTPVSGLTYSFTSLGSTTDDVDFSNNGGITWTYVPTPDVDGLDPAVTDIRIRPKGSFNGSNAQFTLRFRVRVK